MRVATTETLLKYRSESAYTCARFFLGQLLAWKESSTEPTSWWFTVCALLQ